MKNKKEQYIPEPWAGVVFPHERFQHVVTEGPDEVARVSAPGYAGQTEDEMQEGLNKRMNLIIAAPELLSALENLTEALAKGDPQYSMNSEEGAAFEQARAAIAKARGIK